MYTPFIDVNAGPGPGHDPCLLSRHIPSKPTSTDTSRLSLRDGLRPILCDIAQPTACCGTFTKSSATRLLRDGSGHSHFSGRATCKNSWICPVCSQKRAHDRNLILNKQLRELRDECGYTLYTITLTASHSPDDALVRQIALHKSALKSVMSGGSWNEWRQGVQHVISSDITFHPATGFHHHFHLIIAMPPGHEDDIHWFAARWIDEIEKRGRNAEFERQHISEVDNLDAALRYVLDDMDHIPRAEGEPFDIIDIVEKAIDVGGFWIEKIREIVIATRGLHKVATSRGLCASEKKEQPVRHEIAVFGVEAKAEIEAGGLAEEIIDISENAVDVGEARVKVEAFMRANLKAQDWRVSNRTIDLRNWDRPGEQARRIRDRAAAAWRSRPFEQEKEEEEIPF